jgi:hypothetical protein
MNCQFLIPLSSSLRNVIYTQKQYCYGPCRRGKTTYMSWGKDRCLATLWSLEIDVERVLLDPLRFINSRLSLIDTYSL